MMGLGVLISGDFQFAFHRWVLMLANLVKDLLLFQVNMREDQLEVVNLFVVLCVGLPLLQFKLWHLGHSHWLEVGIPGTDVLRISTSSLLRGLWAVFLGHIFFLLQSLDAAFNVLSSFIEVRNFVVCISLEWDYRRLTVIINADNDIRLQTLIAPHWRLLCIWAMLIVFTFIRDLLLSKAERRICPAQLVLPLDRWLSHRNWFPSVPDWDVAEG